MRNRSEPIVEFARCGDNGKPKASISAKAFGAGSWIPLPPKTLTPRRSSLVGRLSARRSAPTNQLPSYPNCAICWGVQRPDPSRPENAENAYVFKEAPLVPALAQSLEMIAASHVAAPTIEVDAYLIAGAAR